MRIKTDCNTLFFFNLKHIYKTEQNIEIEF